MRSHTTHDVLVLGERVIGEDALGNELTESDAPILRCRGRLDRGGTEFVSSTTGERVSKAPTLIVPTHGREPTPDANGQPVEVLSRIEEGMDVQLNDGDERYSIQSIDTLRGRGHRLQNVALSLQKHT